MLTFLHGFLGAPTDWDALNLPGKKITLPGHLGKEVNLELLEQDISDQSTLVGYSLGGRLAMHFALKFPKKINRLIILSAHPGIDKNDKTAICKRQAQDHAWANLLQEQGIDIFLNQWYQQPLFSTLDLSLLKRRQEHDPQSLSHILINWSPAILPSLWESLYLLRSKLVFLFGEHDITYHKVAKRLRRDFDVYMIPNAGHAIHLENPADCARKIQTLIGEFH